MRNNEPQLFSGFIKCADCGYALAYAKKFGTEYYSCGHYRRKGSEYCTQHYINKNVLIEAVLSDIRKYAKLVQEDEVSFAERLACANMDKTAKQAIVLESELKAAEAKHSELDRILKCLYEDSVTGKVTDMRFRKLSAEYEAEQAGLEKQVEDTQNTLAHIRRSRQDSTAWLELIKNYADIQELDRIILGELVEKVTVGEPKVIDGVKNLDITIYYRFVGAVRL